MTVYVSTALVAFGQPTVKVGLYNTPTSVEVLGIDHPPFPIAVRYCVCVCVCVCVSQPVDVYYMAVKNNMDVLLFVFSFPDKSSP